VELSTFIIAVFCLVDDQLKGRRIRQRGPAPKLSDSEVLTIEIVGRSWGSTPTRASTSFSAVTTASGFPPSARYTALPSPGRRPTSGSSRKSSGESSFRLHPMILRSPSVTRCPYRRVFSPAPTAALAFAVRPPSARTRSSGRPSTAFGRTSG
jgi:hypothetical protein